MFYYFVLNLYLLVKDIDIRTVSLSGIFSTHAPCNDCVKSKGNPAKLSSGHVYTIVCRNFTQNIGWKGTEHKDTALKMFVFFSQLLCLLIFFFKSIEITVTSYSLLDYFFCEK